MSPSTEGRIEHAPPRPLAQTNWAIRFICTSNPFYVVSAGLFLAGLWLSCEPEQDDGIGILMAGLAGYTLLLAATAYFLIRHAKVWDDARTVLLLVVLMFLATSVTFDRLLVFETRFENTIPIRGIICNLLGLIFAIIVSEMLLRGVRLKLGLLYRGPYYLLLALFFIYPLALATCLNDERVGRPAMMWGLFWFLPIASVIFLTLLPAIWRGAAYVGENGSPWPWPLYPWSLFGLFAFAAPCRVLLLSYSMHLIDVRDLFEVTFGFYFLLPLGLALSVLLLEGGLASRRDGIVWTALTIPVVLILLSMLGHREELAYQRFLTLFMEEFGASPLYVSLLGAAAYYGYAAIRLVPGAIEALAVALVTAMFVSPQALLLDWDAIVAPQAPPLIAVATVLLGLGIWRRSSWQCLAGALGLVIGLALAFPSGIEVSAYRWTIAFHLAIIATLAIGAAFEDELAGALRFIGSLLVLLACLTVVFVPLRLPGDPPPWVLGFYPVIMTAMLAAYGGWLRHPPTLVMSAFVLSAWLIASGWQIYRACRQFVVGLDYLALSALVFVIAIGISVAKSGILRRWLDSRRSKAPESPE